MRFSFFFLSLIMFICVSALVYLAGYAILPCDLLVGAQSENDTSDFC